MTARGVLARLRMEWQAARRDPALTAMADALRGAVALEPGGPSSLFGRLGVCPVYSRLAALDTLDYADQTLWSGNQVGIEPRRRIIGEAGRLDAIADDSYDAVLASHVLEHLADPLGALAEWQRAVRDGGHLLLVLPHRDGTFDHRRPVTTVEHMRADQANAVGEDDLTHLNEVLELHDIERDPGSSSRAAFEQRCRENLSGRAIHHHVFNTPSAVETCHAAGLDVLGVRAEPPFNIVCLCRVGAGPGEPLGKEKLAQVLATSPFPSDRTADAGLLTA
jgi:SAM-dependent methyltransferase